MNAPTDAIAAVQPALRVGERVSLRVVDSVPPREVLGFVLALSGERVSVVDRRGSTHDLDRAQVDAARRVAVALGRNPASVPLDLLDDLAARAGASGTPWVARISDLLATRTPPATVPPWGTTAEVGGGVRARWEGEWVTLAGPLDPATVADAAVAAAWWSTRMGARSVQVRDDGRLADALGALGFVRR